ncbi:hypothetical protein [Lysinibacillus agricola]|uniref:hypothetical protein n=1 Tax=Lysinibacillus agricola TaxID=2590012 RepID=UPI003C24D787
MAEKIVKIGDKDVKFKVTGQTPLMYMAMFTGSDFLKDFMTIEKAQAKGEALESLTFYKIAYCLAKKGDSEIPNIDEWLESFEDGFPVFEVFSELMPLIQLNFTTTKKKTTRKTTKK